MVRIHLPPARSQQRTLWLPGASHAGGTQSSNPLCFSGESCANLRRGWYGDDKRAPSSFTNRSGWRNQRRRMIIVFPDP